ncbi:hypothetical protein AAV12_04080 [Listeria monocytogenes]|nr:hypothetical protein [Listeria monocytogenes]
MVEIKFAARPNISFDKKDIFDLMMKQHDDEFLRIELECKGKPYPFISKGKMNGIIHKEQLILMRYRYMQAYEERKEQFEKWNLKYWGGEDD